MRDLLEQRLQERAAASNGVAVSVLPLREPSDLAAFIRTTTETASDATELQAVGVPMPYGPDLDDLHHLYALARRSAAVSILEFGSGWSTLVLALALHENATSFGLNYDVRHPNPFRLLSVDASPEYSQLSIDRLPAELRALVDAHVSTVRLIEWQGQLATLFEDLPAFVADLIYLDGPEPGQVTGAIDGIALSDPHGLPMAADLLRLEPMLWPESTIVVDGRTANARFLRTNLRRSWDHLRDPYGDRTTLFLDESAFGESSARHVALRRQLGRELLGKSSKIVA
jgi:hypothetical protein